MDKELIGLIASVVTIIGFCYAIIRNFKEDMIKRFDAIDKRFEVQDKKFEIQDKKFEGLDRKFESKFEGLDRKFEGLDKKFESKFDAQDKKFESRFDAQDKKFESLMNEIRDLRKDLNRIEMNHGERLARIEGILTSKECCMIKDDRQIKKVE